MVVTLRMLASGSSGNALYLSAGDTRLLIDAGIGLRALARALAEVGDEVADLSAVLISHEHSDHVRGLQVLKAKYGHVPVYSSRGTARALARGKRTKVDRPVLQSEQAVTIGSAVVTPFRTSHDAAEPVGFRIEVGDFALGVATRSRLAIKCGASASSRMPCARARGESR